MHDWVELLDLISEDDIAWLLNTGEDRRVESGAVLVTEGTQPDSLFFVIDGVLEVGAAGRNGRPIARLGPGEIVGEISFLDRFPASANVTASEDSRVLELPRNMLSSKLQSDRAFAARFYRALAVILARRLRNATAGTSAARGNEKAAPSDSPAWNALEQAIEQFKLAVSTASSAVVKGEGRIPERECREVKNRLHALIALLHERLGGGSREVESLKKEMGRQVQQELLPYILLTRSAHRLYTKPRGYVGDFQTLDLIYQNREGGSGPLGELIDRLFLDGTIARTLRARRELISAEIRDTVREAESRSDPARVTCLACGPAREVFDVYSSLDDKSRLEATLLDFDLQALARASEEVEHENLASQVRLINGNVVYLALGREQLDLEPQDLVYAAGLIDGYSDSVCKRIIDYGHAVLRPGGKMVLCCFHAENDNREFLEHVLNWCPIHRTEDDLNRLFANSAFGQPCTNLRRDESGATLVAECAK